MNLISCDCCGVVLDKNKINFNQPFDHDGVLVDGAEWDGGKYVATTPCPACGEAIQED